MTLRTTLLALSLAAAAALTACHRPHGAAIAYTGGSYTYYSSESLPKTVRLLDLRTGEYVFTMDVPAGKQLTIDFLPGEGDDVVYTPDLMRYEVFDQGTEFGKLTNALTVPAASSRRIEIFLREGPEYVTAAPERTLRTDELHDRPDWWTPRGGRLPEDQRGTANYRD